MLNYLLQVKRKTRCFKFKKKLLFYLINGNTYSAHFKNLYIKLPSYNAASDNKYLYQCNLS